MTTLTADFGVLGGGIAGLTMAREIARAGRSVVLIEKDDGGRRALPDHPPRRVLVRPGGPPVPLEQPGRGGLAARTDGERPLDRPAPQSDLHRRSFRRLPAPPRPGAAAFGPAKATAIAASYVRALLARRNGLDRSFEDWVIRRFGQVLYGIYFRPYTEKVWGIPCRELSADWASQRISLPSLPQAVYRAIVPTRNPPATIVPDFLYPRSGYGAIGDRLAEEIVRAGGRVECETAVRRIDAGGSDVRVSVAGRAGSVDTLQCGRVISTIPIHALLAALSHEPDVARVAVDSRPPLSRRDAGVPGGRSTAGLGRQLDLLPGFRAPVRPDARAEELEREAGAPPGRHLARGRDLRVAGRRHVGGTRPRPRRTNRGGTDARRLVARLRGAGLLGRPRPARLPRLRPRLPRPP